MSVALDAAVDRARADAERLREVFDTARDLRSARVRIPPGEYHLRPEHSAERELYVSNTVGDDPRFARKRVGLLLQGFDGLEIDATGVEFVLYGRQCALALLDCARVSIRGLTIDWATPTVVDVTVTDAGVAEGRAWRELSVPAVTGFTVVDERSVEWIGDTGADGQPYWRGRDGLEYAQVHDPVSGRTQRVSCPLFDDVARIERTGERSIRIAYTGSERPTDTGLIYQLRETTRDHPGILVDGGAAVVLADLTVRFLHGFGLVAQGGDGLRLERCAFAPPPGTGRVSAGFADFVQCSGMRGRVEIVDSVFDGPHDDPINVHGTYLAVAASADARTLHLEYRHPETAGFPQFAVGDEIAVVDRRTLLPVHRSRVAAVRQPSGRDARRPLRAITLVLDDELTPQVRALTAGDHLAVDNVSRSPELVVSGCVFRHVPTRGVLATTRTVRIERCTFEAVEMACIQIAGDANSWWESGPARDVLIADSRFHGVRAGVLQVAPEVETGTPAVHGTVRLVGNRIDLLTPLLAELRAVEHVVAEDNDIVATVPGILAAVVEATPDVRIDARARTGSLPVRTISPTGEPT